MKGGGRRSRKDLRRLVVRDLSCWRPRKRPGLCHADYSGSGWRSRPPLLCIAVLCCNEGQCQALPLFHPVGLARVNGASHLEACILPRLFHRVCFLLSDLCFNYKTYLFLRVRPKEYSPPQGQSLAMTFLSTNHVTWKAQTPGSHGHDKGETVSKSRASWKG